MRRTLVFALLLAGPAAGQDDSPPTAPASALPEEVVVSGTRELYRLQAALQAAEVRAYDIFNRLNDEKRFDIHCSKQEPINSRIKRQVCLPAFQLEAHRQHAAQYVESVREAFGQGESVFATPHVPQEAVIASQQSAFRRKMREVAEAHPEFLDALIEYTELQERYNSATGASKP